MNASRLHIGLVKYETGWEIVLSQIGVDWSVCDFTKEISPSAYSTIILNQNVSTDKGNILKSYIENGGTILSTEDHAKPLLNSSFRHKYISHFHPDDLFRNSWHEIIDIEQNGKMELCNSTPPFVSTHTAGKGFIASIPFHVASLITGFQSERKNFWSRNTCRFPNEVVAKVTKGGIRRLVQLTLEQLHHARELPFIHKWYFPGSQNSIFTFRVDTDFGAKDQIELLYRTCEKYSIPAMWFLDVKAHEHWLEYFHSLEHQDIGVHCYHHKIFENEKANVENFERALKLLQSNGFNPKGISSPYGIWSNSLGSIFEKLGFSFSSEFGLDYDDLPFFPIVNQNFSKVLQLPIHPISVGVMLRARFTTGDMIKYYLNIIEQNLAFREPICFYHHPTHLQFIVFENIFQYVREKNIQILSYPEYDLWWKKRDQSKFHCEYIRESNELFIKGKEKSEIPLRISVQGNKELFITHDVSIPLYKAEFSSPPILPPVPKEIVRTRKFDWRHLLINYLERSYRKKM